MGFFKCICALHPVFNSCDTRLSFINSCCLKMKTDFDFYENFDCLTSYNIYLAANTDKHENIILFSLFFNFKLADYHM